MINVHYYYYYYPSFISRHLARILDLHDSKCIMCSHSSFTSRMATQDVLMSVHPSFISNSTALARILDMHDSNWVSILCVPIHLLPPGWPHSPTIKYWGFAIKVDSSVLQQITQGSCQTGTVSSEDGNITFSFIFFFSNLFYLFLGQTQSVEKNKQVVANCWVSKCREKKFSFIFWLFSRFGPT